MGKTGACGAVATVLLVSVCVAEELVVENEMGSDILTVEEEEVVEEIGEDDIFEPEEVGESLYEEAGTGEGLVEWSATEESEAKKPFVNIAGNAVTMAQLYPSSTCKHEHVFPIRNSDVIKYVKKDGYVTNIISKIKGIEVWCFDCSEDIAEYSVNAVVNEPSRWNSSGKKCKHKKYNVYKVWTDAV